MKPFSGEVPSCSVFYWSVHCRLAHHHFRECRLHTSGNVLDPRVGARDAFFICHFQSSLKGASTLTGRTRGYIRSSVLPLAKPKRRRFQNQKSLLRILRKNTGDNSLVLRHTSNQQCCGCSGNPRG